MLDKTLDDSGRKALCSEFAKIMQQVYFLACFTYSSCKMLSFMESWFLLFSQGYANLPAGICVSSMGRPVSYEQATVWKVLDDNESNHCLAFILVNWSFVWRGKGLVMLDIKVSVLFWLRLVKLEGQYVIWINVMIDISQLNYYDTMYGRMLFCAYVISIDVDLFCLVFIF